MIRIDAENGYYIDFCDRYSVALVQRVVLSKGKRRGEEEYIVRGYYGSLEPLLRSYIEAVSKEPAGSLKEIIVRLKKAERAVREMSGRTKEDFKSLMTEESRRKSGK